MEDPHRCDVTVVFADDGVSTENFVGKVVTYLEDQHHCKVSCANLGHSSDLVTTVRRLQESGYIIVHIISSPHLPFHWEPCISHLKDLVASRHGRVLQVYFRVHPDDVIKVSSEIATLHAFMVKDDFGAMTQWLTSEYILCLLTVPVFTPDCVTAVRTIQQLNLSKTWNPVRSVPVQDHTGWYHTEYSMLHGHASDVSVFQLPGVGIQKLHSSTLEHLLILQKLSCYLDDGGRLPGGEEKTVRTVVS